MRAPFNGSFKINQNFNDPCCRQTYKNAFGWTGHNGIDYNLPQGTPVVASNSGTIYSGWEANGYGNFIFITGEGYETVYGHLSRIIRGGGSVKAGELIGYSGNTGFSSGPHLHFGARPIGYNRNNGFGGYVDPLPLFNKTQEDRPLGPNISSTDQARRIYLDYNIDVPGNDPALQRAVGTPELELRRGVAATVRNTETALRKRISELETGAKVVPVGQLFVEKN